MRPTVFYRATCRLNFIRTSFGRLRTFSTGQQCDTITIGDISLQKRTGDNDTGIAVLSLNRTTTRNALAKEFVHDFRTHLRQIADDRSIRVLVLQSLVPGVFCAGADLRERLKMSNDEIGPFVGGLRSLCMEIDRLPMPTIAALDGVALGGGLEIALSCDLRVAAANVKLGLVETKLAIIPGAGGTQRLPRLIGLSKAKELIFTGRVIDGQQALELGLVNVAVAQNGTRTAASLCSIELAQEILTQAPLALRAAKEAIQKGIEAPDMDAAMEVERACYDQVIPTKDRIEGLRSFVEKRAPVYRGE